MVYCKAMTEEYLKTEYSKKGKSVKQIAQEMGLSESGINYWLSKYKIKKRSISEAVYLKSNPKGDPFTFREPSNNYEWFLLGMGLGLYWGEGNKANKNSVRLGNSDPALIKKFIEFLIKIYHIDKNKLRFGLQLFSDVDEEEALNFWAKYLKISRNNFYKVIVTESGKIGSYRVKNKYGVLTLYFSNTKLRDTIVTAIKELR